MGEKMEKPILKEAQKRAEKLLFDDDSLVQHPYSLSLDIYKSTLVSLVTYDTINTTGMLGIYKVDEGKIANITADLERMIVRSPGSYLNVILQFSDETDGSLQAKL